MSAAPGGAAPGGAAPGGAAPGAAAPAEAGSWAMLRTLVGLGLLCGLLIVGAYELTRPVIERNRAEALRAAIFRVLPRAASSETFELRDDGSFAPAAAAAAGPAAGARVLYAGYDGQGGLVGLAIEARGMGYQDTITLLYGYSLEEDAVVGIQVLESRETPGLGDKIEKDPAFQRNFERLDASLDDEGAAPRHRIVAVKHGAKQNPWEVDAITGATISSNAVADILAQSTAAWAPLVERRAADFELRGSP